MPTTPAKRRARPMIPPIAALPGVPSSQSRANDTSWGSTHEQPSAFAAAAGLIAPRSGRRGGAQQPVKIGIIYPLSGNSASAGNYSKMAIEVGADVVNNGNARAGQDHADRQGRRPVREWGAKVQLVFADNQGTPAAGQNQALRLISEEKVAALIGAYQSASP